jgi:Flp pilus assembly protein TadD
MMRLDRLRVLVITAGSLLWLAGCETWNQSLGTTTSTGAEATGSIVVSGAPDIVDGTTPASTGLQGDNPKDDLNLGKKHYRDNSFGLAEQHFRRAVEQGPRNVEAWIGLAASYDKLKRFDLADRAYEQAIKLVGQTAEILNNQGYSYLLRGDHRRARAKLLAAQAKDPSNPYIQNNLALLDESFAKRRGVQ